jgi:Paraquat-inducible protein A
MDTELVAIDTTTGLPKINDAIIDPLTELQSNETGTISFPGNLLDLNAGFSIEGLAANVRFEVSDVRIENLNTVGEPLRLLDPVSMEPYVLDNALTAGTSITPLRLAAHVLLEVIGDGELNVYDEVTLSVDITAATVALLVFLKLRSDQFVRFPIGNILNLNCWLATMPATELDSRGVRVNDQDTFASVQRLNLDLERIALDVKCINCSSPLLFDLSASLTAPGAVEDATKSANKVLDYFIALVEGEFLQNKIDRLLNEAPMKCPHSPEFVDNPIKPIYTPFENSEESDSVTFVITLAMSTLGIIFAWALVSYAVKCFVRRRNVKWLRSLPDEKILSIYRYQCQQKEQEAALNETTSSMFSSSEIPIIVRWLVPLIILGNIGFFLSGHLSIGGTVIVKVSLAGQEITIEDFFQFSIAQSTLDLWNAGGKALAILILIFSGVWPYAKMFITLFCWFVPPSRLSVTRRGSILIWLDVMAKWSTIDIFVMVVSLVAFRITISSPKLSFLPSEFYSVDLLVVPLWGLYANLIAQLLSQITSHYIIYYHRSIVRNGMATVCTNESEIEEVKGIPAIAMSGSDTRKDALKDQAFSRPHRGEKDLLGVRPGVNEGLLTAVALLFVLTISGCALPCFSVDILGILGIAVQSGQDFQPAITNYSVFDIMKLLLDEAALLGTPKDWIGLLSISLVFLLTILVVPLIQGLLLLYHWWLPMTQPRHQFFVALIEICQAWQFLEVFVIAIMVSAWQLGPVSEFLINSYCDSLQPTLAALVYFGIIADEDAQCFKVRASIESGTFFMISAAFVLSFLNGFVVTAAAQYQRDCIARDEALRQDIKPDHQTIRMLEEGNVEETIEKIQPMPALFTDQFRWWLVSNSRMREEENAITVDPQPQVQQIPAGSLRAAHAPPRKCEDTEPDIVVKHLEPTAQDRNSEHPCESPIDNLGYSRREEPATTRRSQPVLPERE